MTILDQVRRLIERLAPDPICDACIAERLDLPDQGHVIQMTRELAGSDGFERRKGVCAVCGATKLATRRRAR